MKKLSSNNSLHPAQAFPSSKMWVKTIFLIVTFVSAYFDTLHSFIRVWSVRDDYSHGFLVPFISLYFVYADREKLKQLTIRPNMRAGVPLFGAGIMMLLLGSLGSVVKVQQTSLIIAVPGLILLLLGTQYLKALALPLLYLILMVPPLLDAALSKIHWPFQLFSAIVADGLLNIISIPVHRISNLLELPNVTLEVANECSGVRYIISIIAIAVPLAFITQKKRMKRLMLILSAIVIGIIANPLRVTLIGVWAYKYGGEIHGPGHILHGFFVSMVGFVSLFLLAFLIGKIPIKNLHEVKRNGGIPACGNSSDAERFDNAWVVAIILLLGLTAYLHLHTSKPVSLRSPLYALPLTVGEWEGENAHYPENFYYIEGADSELFRLYRDGAGHEIKLYIAYCETQRQDKKIINYKLQKFYENVEEISIPLAYQNHIRMNKTVLEDNLKKTLVLYWYDLNGRTTANLYKAKFITAIDGLIHLKTNGALIMLMMDIDRPEHLESNMKKAEEFVKDVYPFIEKSLPLDQPSIL